MRVPVAILVAAAGLAACLVLWWRVLRRPPETGHPIAGLGVAFAAFWSAVIAAVAAVLVGVCFLAGRPAIVLGCPAIRTALILLAAAAAWVVLRKSLRRARLRGRG